MPKLKTRTAWAITCPACECGDILHDQDNRLVIFDTREDALVALSHVIGDDAPTEENIIKIRVAEHHG